MNRLKDTVLKPVGDQFDRLTELILRQLSITRQLLAGNSSAELRDELNRNESAIDGLEVSIRDEVVNVIVLHAPRASNLRIIMACYDTTSNLERIGDQATNIAEAVIFVTEGKDIKHTDKNLL